MLIKDEGFLVDDLAGAGFVSLADISATDKFLDLPNDADVASVRDLFSRLAAIRIEFTSFTDGRGFSLARKLRASGYFGRLRAYGHLIPDQYCHARRCGFDEVEITDLQGRRQPQNQWLDNTEQGCETYQDRLLRAG